MFGRVELLTSVTEVTDENVLEVLQKAEQTHIRNAAEIQYLYEYWRGYQPILEREKLIRPEINNTIVENHAHEIVSFKTGYEFGEPIQYVRRGIEEGSSDKIDRLNEYMLSLNKPKQDKDLAEWFHICGVAYRMVLPADRGSDAPFEFDTLDPRSTGIIRNNGFGKRPIMGFTKVTKDNGEVIHSCYTRTKYYEISNLSTVVRSNSHTLGNIPIIEYPANSARLGAFEVVLGLLDAINKTTSDRLNGIEQFIQSFIKFVNCDVDPDTFESLKAMGAVKVKTTIPGVPSDVQIISSELNQGEAQISKDDLYQMVLIICGMPDRNGSNRTTGDTGQAVILRDGWGSAESRARATELMFKASEKEFLRIALRIANQLSGLGLEVSDIDIKFTRNKTDNLLVKTQGLQNLLEAGIEPRTAIATTGLFSDPELVFANSEEYMKKWLLPETQITPTNNKPNPEQGE